MATSPEVHKVFFVKDWAPTLAKMYVYLLSFEHLKVLATLTSTSAIRFHLSHNIKLAALIWKKKNKRSFVPAEVCG